MHVYTYAFAELDDIENPPLSGIFEWGNAQNKKKVLLQKYDGYFGYYVDLPFMIKKLTNKHMSLVYGYNDTQASNVIHYIAEEFELDQVKYYGY